MKSSSLAKAITLGCLVLVALPVACGDETSNGSPKPSPSAGAGGDGPGPSGNGGADDAGGAGGAAPVVMLPPGISDTSKTIECSSSCTSGKVGLGASVYYLDPCCGGAGDDECGLNTAFLASAGVMFEQTCQPKGQVGPLDDGCPAPPAAVIPMGATMLSLDPFAGCCRAETGTCGVFVDAVTLGGGALPLGALGLGCVDAAPFFGTPGKACGAGLGGAGGATGTGGAADGGASLGGAATGGAGGAP